MYKELIISFIIIVAIIFGNNITQGYTKNTVTELSDDLTELKTIMEQKDEEIKWEEVDKKIQNLEEKWAEKYSKMAFYIEHNELEKIKINLIGIKSYANKHISSEVLPQLNNSISILNYIKEKNALSLKNIF